MASVAQAAIAKASLAAVLLRPDPEPVARDEIDAFTAHLARTASRCSPAHVQACKQWMLRHVVASAPRSAAVGRYLVALSSLFRKDADKKETDKKESEKESEKETKETSARRKRLHLLYIVNDVLFHTVVRDGVRAFANSIVPSLEPLVVAAASFERAPKQTAKIGSLLDLWAEQGYFAGDVVAQLRAAVDKASTQATETDVATATATTRPTPSSQKEPPTVPYTLPALHGDPATPWYDLPAGNWLVVLEPDSARPMKTTSIRPVRLTPGPAPPALVDALCSLLADVDRIYGDDTDDDGLGAVYDTDALGERVELDAFGDVLDGDTYYGWSRAFCQRIKSRDKTHQTTLRQGDRDDRARLPAAAPHRHPPPDRRGRGAWTRG